jgi:hypothetical protein
MGLFSRVLTTIVNHEAECVESTEALNNGICEILARGSAPDRIRAEQAAYHAEVMQVANPDAGLSAAEIAAAYGL